MRTFILKLLVLKNVNVLQNYIHIHTEDIGVRCIYLPIFKVLSHYTSKQKHLKHTTGPIILDTAYKVQSTYNIKQLIIIFFVQYEYDTYCSWFRSSKQVLNARPFSWFTNESITTHRDVLFKDATGLGLILFIHS